MNNLVRYPVIAYKRFNVRYLRLVNESWRWSSSGTDKPIQFTTSKAAKWVASDGFGPPRPDFPSVQPYSVIFGTAAFLIYFCILREENDIDDGLRTSLYDRIPGLEEKDLINVIKYNEEKQLDTKDLKLRLKEIEDSRRLSTS